ncbi:aldehyde dehydrogenase family protein, partial [Streptomyces europaeiscabiei]|uniref:aldehyde dehydrogenase family protein n=1 Tax=Streptomyces europaeiscabiei TaxID=146819 RepID=UPI0023E277A6
MRGPVLSEQSQQYEQQLQVLNPATEEVVASVPAAGAADVDAAVALATGVQRRWPATAPAD